jgi:cytochrome oxidase assembly protein ShyY1
MQEVYSRRDTHDRKFIQMQTTLIVISFAIMSCIGVWSMQRLRVTPAEVLQDVKELREEVKELRKATPSAGASPRE